MFGIDVRSKDFYLFFWLFDSWGIRDLNPDSLYKENQSMLVELQKLLA